MGRSVPKIPKHSGHAKRQENPWESQLNSRSVEPTSIEWGQVIGKCFLAILFLIYGLTCVWIGQNVKGDKVQVVEDRN